MFSLKRAAVFGMDARIAIVIFSILGAVGAYYTSDIINNAQNDSVVDQVVTLRQAAMQNIIDNDYDYTIDDVNLNGNLFGVYNAASGLKRGRNNNTYINQTNPTGTVGATLINTPNRVIEVVNDNMYSSDANTGASYKTTDCADTLTECFYWFRLNNVNEESFKLLDGYFDATTGGFADTTSTDEGIIVAPTIDTGNDSAVVLVKIGER